MTFPYGEQVILHRRTKTGVDADNIAVYDWTDYSLDGCAFWPAGSVEVVQGQDRVTDTPTVAVPPDSIPTAVGSILPTDQLTARGVRYEIDGTPVDYGPSPLTGTRFPVTVRLKNVTG